MGENLRVLQLGEIQYLWCRYLRSDEQSEAFQFCSNLREIEVSFAHAEFTGEWFAFEFTGKQFSNTQTLNILRFVRCRFLEDVSGIRYLEFLNELSFSDCQFVNESDSTFGTAQISLV